ncbi:Uncharacterised protein [Mycoplasmopsis californica]|uniref:Membrane protein P80 n=1 Tax=Mycoplasmopsis equigenitalium TaxID=114883 RepID=A0ABY5J135_9BACT|nr:hypothetical protein [Mycoplasmopsis equigenitalium]UUD36959.1 hypothetical protein NPA09_00030 [Mycoplasmopsis equigenitalium]VEU69746.1 Uncharacterised protein [Mycoplasmopsis californica]
MANKKESFFERLARKNTEKETVNLKSKKARIATYSILGGLAAAITIGISVPIIVSSTKKNYIPPISDNEQIFEFRTPDGVIKVPFSEIKSFLDNPSEKETEKTQNAFIKEAIYKLYEEEYIDSLKFEYLVNKTKRSGVSDRTDIHLRSLKEIKKLNRDKILDLKNLYQKNYGLDKWEKEFIKVIAQQYQGARSIEEAVDNAVLKEITADALRRFTLSRQNFNAEDWDRTAPRDIKELEIVDGIVQEKKGGAVIYKYKDYIFRDKLLKAVVDFNDIKNDQNTVLKYENNDPNGRVEKLYVFLNDSFSLDPTKRSAWKIIEKFAEKEENIQITKASIFGVANTTNAAENWSVDKKQLINLFAHSAIKGLQNSYKLLEKNKEGVYTPDLQGHDTFEHENLDLFFHFFNNINTATPNEEEKKINTILKAYLPKIVGSLAGNLGTKDIEKLNKAAASLGDEELLTLLNSNLKIAKEDGDFTNSPLWKSLNEFKTKIADFFATKDRVLIKSYKKLKQEYDNEQTKPAEQRKIKLSQVVKAYNAALADLINSLSEDEVKQEFGSILKNDFYGVNGENTRTFYAAKKDGKTVYIVPTAEGILLISYTKITSKAEDIFKGIIGDLKKRIHDEPVVFNYEQTLLSWLRSNENIQKLFLLDHLQDSDYETIKAKLLADENLKKESVEEYISRVKLTAAFTAKIQESTSTTNANILKKMKDFIEKQAKGRQKVDFTIGSDPSKIQLVGFDGTIIDDALNKVINLLIEEILKGGA